jgi:hypothetical protein
MIARWAGAAFAVAAVSFFLTGIWTYTFHSTVGTVLVNERYRFRPVGDYSQGKGSRFWKRTVEGIDICYEYRVAAQIHESCHVGAGVSHLTLSPLARAVWEDAQPGTEVPVYYFDAKPSISVLHKGPDWIAVFGLAVVSPFLFLLAKRLRSL